jgi:hypothetical protein
MESVLPLLLTVMVVVLTTFGGPFAFFYIYLTLPITIPLLVACMWISHQIKVFGIANGYWEPQPPLPADNSPTYYVPTGRIRPSFGSDRQELRRCIFTYKNGNPDHYIHISQWDVSKVKDMSYVFHNLIQTKRDNDAISGIEDWDMSHVENMDSMFSMCPAFNQPIGKWKLPLVRNLGNLFFQCKSFFQSLEEWEHTVAADVGEAPVSIKDVFNETDRYWQRHPWLEILRKRNQSLAMGLNKMKIN